MLDVFHGLRLVVKRRVINIDNAIFRCHWFFTSTLLVSFSVIITARQYVGQPIECHSMNKIPNTLLNSYCWVQSTFTVPQACGLQVGLEVPYPCIDNTRGREIKIYAYYQWIGMVLFVQGLLFHLPYYLWKVWENGLIGAITTGLRVAVLSDQERTKKREIVVEYIYEHLGCHRTYAYKYFLCEFICLINLIGQIWCVNRFFDGHFLTYGLDVIQHSQSQSQPNRMFQNNNTIASLTNLNPQNNLINQNQQQHQQQQQLLQLTSRTGSDKLSVSPIDQYGKTNSQNLFQQNTQQQQQQIISTNNNNFYPSSIATQQHQQSQISNHQLAKAPPNLPNNNLINLHVANNRQIAPIDPMSFVFPRVTKCTYYDFGSSGDVQKHDALCLLPLNIINEKIYIALWFWFFTLAILTALVIVYRLCAIASPSVRCRGLVSRCKLSSEHQLELICASCDVGDWFLFYMVAENVDPIVMREIVSSLADKLTADNSFLLADKATKQQLLDVPAQLDAQSLINHGPDVSRSRSRLDFNINNDRYQNSNTNSNSNSNSNPNTNQTSQQAQVPIRTSTLPIFDGWSSTEATSSGGQRASSTRNTIAQANECLPLGHKFKKPIYSKKLWSSKLGPANLRRQFLFGEWSRSPEEQQETIQPAESTWSSSSTTNPISREQNQQHLASSSIQSFRFQVEAPSNNQLNLDQAPTFFGRHLRARRHLATNRTLTDSALKYNNTNTVQANQTTELLFDGLSRSHSGACSNANSHPNNNDLQYLQTSGSFVVQVPQNHWSSSASSFRRRSSPTNQFELEDVRQRRHQSMTCMLDVERQSDYK